MDSIGHGVAIAPLRRRTSQARRGFGGNPDVVADHHRLYIPARGRVRQAALREGPSARIERAALDLAGALVVRDQHAA